MSEIKTLQPLVAPAARQEALVNDAIEWNVEGEPQQIVLSKSEIVVLGCPATSDDVLKDAEHNCDVMGCGLCHVLWRHDAHATLTEQLAEAQAKNARLEAVCREQGHLYFNAKHTGRRLFFSDAGWELEPHRNDKDGFYFDTVLEAFECCNAQGEPIQEGRDGELRKD